MLNINYGRLENGRIIFAPLPLVYIGGEPVCDSESYINAGYKPIKRDYHEFGGGTFRTIYTETDDCILERISENL